MRKDFPKTRHHFMTEHYFNSRELFFPYYFVSCFLQIDTSVEECSTRVRLLARVPSEVRSHLELYNLVPFSHHS